MRHCARASWLCNDPATVTVRENITKCSSAGFLFYCFSTAARSLISGSHCFLTSSPFIERSDVPVLAGPGTKLLGSVQSWLQISQS
jgi:hypothetical protein